MLSAPAKFQFPWTIQEIRSLQRVVKEQMDVSPSDFLTVGDRVRIIEALLPELKEY